MNPKVSKVLLTLFLIVFPIISYMYLKTGWEMGKEVRAEIKDYGAMAPFSFISSNGDTLDNEFFKGKIYIADFIFTRCQGICPVLSSEMHRIQEHFKDSPWIGYWHDFGHVQLKHNLGLLDHDQWLGKMAPYLIGAHVHDVEWPARDHRTPFTGELDYAALLPHFPADAPLTWELSPTRKTAQVQDALAVWRHKFPDR